MMFRMDDRVAAMQNLVVDAGPNPKIFRTGHSFYRYEVIPLLKDRHFFRKHRHIGFIIIGLRKRLRPCLAFPDRIQHPLGLAKPPSGVDVHLLNLRDFLFDYLIWQMLQPDIEYRHPTFVTGPGPNDGVTIIPVIVHVFRIAQQAQVKIRAFIDQT
jgi:hypothetical protein